MYEQDNTTNTCDYVKPDKIFNNIWPEFTYKVRGTPQLL